jgi:hypothetical protein
MPDLIRTGMSRSSGIEGWHRAASQWNLVDVTREPKHFARIHNNDRACGANQQSNSRSTGSRRVPNFDRCCRGGMIPPEGTSANHLSHHHSHYRRTPDPSVPARAQIGTAQLASLIDFAHSIC